MREFLLPHTDAGVVTQVAVLATATVAAVAAARRHPELRLLAAGVGIFLFSIISLRALH